jgi:hypothetical protein
MMDFPESSISEIEGKKRVKVDFFSYGDFGDYVDGSDLLF